MLVAHVSLIHWAYLARLGRRHTCSHACSWNPTKRCRRNGKQQASEASRRMSCAAR
ncbi:hypothetical protein CGRA01v4_03339 [Colletotrichum graminicola]|nr:hypothetical protein CGRA01v4_03339 [Colletotrichum graminicola]